MRHAVLYVPLSRPSELAEALERVEELRTVVPVEVEEISTVGDSVSVVLKVPDDSVELVRKALPGVLVA